MDTPINYRRIVYAKISEDGSFLIGKIFENIAAAWTRCGGTWKFLWEQHISISHPQITLTISPDNQYFTTVTLCNIEVYSCLDGSLVRTLSGHADSIGDISWSPCSTRIVSCSNKQDGNFRVWNVEKGTQVFAERTEICFFAASYSRDGKYIATGGEFETLYIWDTANRKLLRKLQAEKTTGTIWCVRWSPDGRHIVTGGSGVISVWNTDTWEQVAKYPYRASVISWYSDLEFMSNIDESEKGIRVIGIYARVPIETFKPLCGTVNSLSQKSLVMVSKNAINVYEPLWNRFSSILCGILQKHSRTPLSDPRFWGKVQKMILPDI